MKNIITKNDLKRKVIKLKTTYQNDIVLLTEELNKECLGTPYTFLYEDFIFSFFKNGGYIFNLEINGAHK